MENVIKENVNVKLDGLEMIALNKFVQIIVPIMDYVPVLLIINVLVIHFIMVLTVHQKNV
jgi:hypothetical protein